jgi:lipopolysaccharide transport system permease protein
MSSPKMSSPKMSSLKMSSLKHRFHRRLTRSRYRRWWEKFDLLKILIQRDLEARYKGSILGRFWVVVNQIAQLLVYTYAFSIVLKAKPPELNALPIQPESFAYGLWLFAGLVPWNAFTMGVTQSSTAVLSQPNLVKKVVFPLALLPLVPVGATFLESSLGLMLLLSAIALSTQNLPPLTVLCLPLVWVPQLLLTAGLGYFTSGLTVFLRDIPQTLGVVTNLWFYLTPIVYSANILPQEWQQTLLWVNPMAAIVQLYRDFLGFRPLTGATLAAKAPIHWAELGVVWLVATIVFAIGFSLYQRLRKGFADVL